MLIGYSARRIPIRTPGAFALIRLAAAYVVVPAMIGWFAFVVIAGTAALQPSKITVPSPEVYNPYLDDFTVFYAAGSLARDGAGEDVYDVAAIHEKEAEVAGQDPRDTVELPFFGPPFTLGVFAGLALLPLEESAVVWTAVGLGCVTLCAIALARRRRGLSATTLLIWALGILAAPPFFQTLIHGQTTFLLVSGFVLLIPSVARSGRAWPTTFGLVLICPQTATCSAPRRLPAPRRRVAPRGSRWRRDCRTFCGLDDGTGLAHRR